MGDCTFLALNSSRRCWGLVTTQANGAVGGDYITDIFLHLIPSCPGMDYKQLLLLQEAYAERT